MFNKIKEYLSLNPNSSIWAAIICSVTAMNTEEWISLLSAMGLFLSTVWGLISKAWSDYITFRENRIQKTHDRELEQLRAINEAERYKVETQLLLNSTVFINTEKPL